MEQRSNSQKWTCKNVSIQQGLIPISGRESATETVDLDSIPR